MPPRPMTASPASNSMRADNSGSRGTTCATLSADCESPRPEGAGGNASAVGKSSTCGSGAPEAEPESCCISGGARLIGCPCNRAVACRRSGTHCTMPHSRGRPPREKEAGDRTFQATRPADAPTGLANRRRRASQRRERHARAMQPAGALPVGALALAQSARGSPSLPCSAASPPPRSGKPRCVVGRSQRAGGPA